MKECFGLWVPDEEHEMPKVMGAADGRPRFAGAGTYQFRKFAAAFPYIRTFGRAIDIGANVGSWTRVMGRCFDQVEAFEPMPEHHECFERNMIEADRAHITLHRMALGAEEGERQFIFNTCFTHAVTEDEQVNPGIVSFPIKPLDAMGFEHVDFIKIDVEGLEYDVVRGAEQLIRRSRPCMIVEQKPSGFAERYGHAQEAASRLLQNWGAEVVMNFGGDHILRWK